MESETHKVLRLGVRFPDRTLAKPVIQELSQGSSVSVNILHGRLTEKEVWFELELSGSAPKVDEVIRLIKEWGIVIRYPRKCVFCAS